jgi:hypothetical protein
MTHSLTATSQGRKQRKAIFSPCNLSSISLASVAFSSQRVKLQLHLQSRGYVYVVVPHSFNFHCIIVITTTFLRLLLLGFRRLLFLMVHKKKTSIMSTTITGDVAGREKGTQQEQQKRKPKNSGSTSPREIAPADLDTTSSERPQQIQPVLAQVEACPPSAATSKKHV